MFYLPTNYTHQLTADEASAIHKISKDYALIIDNKKFKSLRYRAASDEHTYIWNLSKISVSQQASPYIPHKTSEDLAATEIQKLFSEVSLHVNHNEFCVQFNFSFFFLFVNY